MTSLPTTDPTPSLSFAEQEPAVLALAEMAQAFPHLPAAAFTLYQPEAGGGLFIQTHSGEAFEAWREALRIGAAAVELKTNGADSWLRAEGSFSGSAVTLSGWGIPTCAPRDSGGRAAEQRQQLDPADGAFAALAPTGGAA